MFISVNPLKHGVQPFEAHPWYTKETNLNLYYMPASTKQFTCTYCSGRMPKNVSVTFLEGHISIGQFKPTRLMYTCFPGLGGIAHFCSMWLLLEEGRWKSQTLFGTPPTTRNHRCQLHESYGLASYQACPVLP